MLLPWDQWMPILNNWKCLSSEFRNSKYSEILKRLRMNGFLRRKICLDHDLGFWFTHCRCREIHQPFNANSQNLLQEYASLNSTPNQLGNPLQIHETTVMAFTWNYMFGYMQTGTHGTIGISEPNHLNFIELLNVCRIVKPLKGWSILSLRNIQAQFSAKLKHLDDWHFNSHDIGSGCSARDRARINSLFR